MSRTMRVEWIGARSPQQDDVITFRKITGVYTEDQIDMLDLIEEYVAPLIRIDGGTARRFGPKQGFSQTYQWGPRRGTFVVDMLEVDVHRLFNKTSPHPDHLEFRNLEDNDHDGRVPEIPYAFITKMVHRMLEEGINGPPIVVTNERTFATNKAIVAALKEREAEMHERKEHRRLY